MSPSTAVPALATAFLYLLLLTYTSQVSAGTTEPINPDNNNHSSSVSNNSNSNVSNSNVSSNHNNSTASNNSSSNYVYYPVCEYDGRQYPAGSTFSPEPCVQCRCNATSGHVLCSVPPCANDANCIRYEHPGSRHSPEHSTDFNPETSLDHSPEHSTSPAKDSCCPRCVQRGCYYQNQRYLPGDIIDVNPCKRCYCPQEGGSVDTGAPNCLSIRCPQVRCVDPVTEEGSCCPVCPDGPNYWLDDKAIREGERVYIDKCRFCFCSNMEYIYDASKRHATCVRSLFCL